MDKPIKTKIYYKEYNVNIKKDMNYHNLEYIAMKFLEKKWNILLKKSLKRRLNKIYKPGIPDFFYEKDNKKIFIEIKCNKDGLRKKQFRWIMNNPQYKIYIIWFNIKVIKTEKDLFIIKDESKEYRNFLRKIMTNNEPVEFEYLEKKFKKKFKDYYNDDLLEDSIYRLRNCGEMFCPRLGFFVKI